MIEYESECVGCTSLGLHCIGEHCPNRNVPHYYCDECGEEDTLYEYEGEELCIECIKNKLRIIGE
jgi:hypothetical protein